MRVTNVRIVIHVFTKEAIRSTLSDAGRGILISGLLIASIKYMRVMYGPFPSTVEKCEYHVKVTDTDNIL